MDNATELYLMFKGKDTARSPGQWLNIKSTKELIKKNKLKKPKKDDQGEYMFESELYEAYKNYLNGNDDSPEDDTNENKKSLVELLVLKFGEEKAQYVLNVFYQKIIGHSIPLVTKSTGLKPNEFIESCTENVKLIFLSLSIQLIAYSKLQKIISKTWVESRTHDALNLFANSGLRTTSDVIFQNEKAIVTFSKIKEK